MKTSYYVSFSLAKVFTSILNLSGGSNGKLGTGLAYVVMVFFCTWLSADNFNTAQNCYLDVRRAQNPPCPNFGTFSITIFKDVVNWNAA